MSAENKTHLDASTGRASAIWGTAVFLFVAPGTAVGLVPWWISRWRFQSPLLGFTPFRIIGVVLIATGLPMLLESFKRFALQGLGTPAPVFPTKHLVVTGFYRYVRNPMYAAVVSMILGQALVLGDIHLLEYAGLFWLATHIFVMVYEEPTLRSTYGAEYESFCANVHRWIPRLTPWRNASR
jgi:protein-S-isoprenylcysteine O-methyltransferase Ste14